MKKQLGPHFTVAYEEAGRGLPVVLLHAFPFDQAMWRPQREGLAGLCRLITPDLRGFGGTGGFEGVTSLETIADDVPALLDALGMSEPVVLGGLSMGGYVALAVARKYPRRLRGLILADTRAEADSPEGKANRDNLIAFMESHSARDLIGQMLPKLVCETTRTSRPGVVAEAERIASAQSPAGIRGALQAMRDRPDSTGVLGDIQVPTLVVVGSDDALTPPATARTLAEGIREAQLVTIPGAGHLSNLEQPEAFNNALRSFLETLAGS